MKSCIKLFLYASLVTFIFSNNSFASEVKYLNFANTKDLKDFMGSWVASNTTATTRVAKVHGLLGFDIGAETGIINTDYDAKGKANDKWDKSKLYSGVNASKGVIGGIDLGLNIREVSGGAKITSFEIRKSIIKGLLAIPAVTFKAEYTDIDGGKRLKANQLNAELSASVSMLILKVFGGIGFVESTVRLKKDADKTRYNLKDYKVSDVKTFLGASMSLFQTISLTVAANKIGDSATIYSAKIAAGF